MLHRFWQKTAFYAPHPALQLCGVVALLVYAGTKMAFDSLGSASESFVIITGFAFIFMRERSLRSSAPMWFLLGALTVQLATWSAAYLSNLETMGAYPQLDRLARWFIFIPIAWWLGGSSKNTLLFWGVAALAIMLTPWIHGDGWSEWQRGLAGSRVDFIGGESVSFGIRNAQHTAMLFGAILLGLFAFSRRAVFPGRFVWWRFLLCLTAISICLIAILVIQTRAVWLALFCVVAVVVVGVGIAAMVMALRQRKLMRISAWWLVVLILIVGLLVSFKDNVVDRLSADSRIITMAFSGDVEALGYGSIGLRLKTWKLAVAAVAQRPLFGWGKNGPDAVISGAKDLAKQSKAGLGHLHNSFLEILVRYGLLGAGLVLLFYVWLTRAAIAAWRMGRMPGDFLAFYLCFLVFWAVVNVFESYLFFSTGIFTANVVTAGVVTHIWPAQVAGSAAVQKRCWSRRASEDADVERAQIRPTTAENQEPA